MKRAVALNVN